MAILNNNPLVGASGNQGGYNINNSLRFRSSASAYLSRTPASATNRKTWTWSAWVKRGQLGSIQHLFRAGNTLLRFISSDVIQFERTSGTVPSTAVYRDPSAWYHIVAVLDTTQATDSNRIKIYINGIQISLSGTWPALNTDYDINNSVIHYIGQNTANAEYFDGYMAEVNFIDGQALTPSSFGETDTTTGVWKPKAYTSTYGTNGFYLKFSDIATTSGSNAGLGKDFSGNGNYWTTNNISVTSGTTYDAMTDSPTNTSATVANYAVLNPLWKASTGTLSSANLNYTDSDSLQKYVRGTIGVTSGKWYFEGVFTNTTSAMFIGMSADTETSTSGNAYIGNSANGWSMQVTTTVNKVNNGTFTSISSTNYINTSNVFQVAYDADNGKLFFGVNNTWFGSADPVAGTNAQFTGVSGTLYPSIGTQGNGAVAINFGQRPFSYTPPTGYVALNTYNLPTPTILQGNKYMDATTYTGTATANQTQTITNAAGFSPDLVWVKSRSLGGSNHMLSDSVRGFGTNCMNSLFTDSTSNELSDLTNPLLPTGYGAIFSLNSNGFTLKAGSTNGNQVNTSGQTYVGWQWQAGQGTNTTNTAGSITSTVSVNATAGFSIVTYTGNATANATVGHGLGVAPKFFVVKVRSGTGEWLAYHISTGKDGFMQLQSTSAFSSSANYWGSTGPTSTTFQINGGGGVNNNGSTYVAYCWAEIAGFSKFGSYTGNGSADGSFVYTGFRPKYVLVKRTSAIGNWVVWDSSRNTYNLGTNNLFPNTSDAEDTSGAFDLLSNGFKLRDTNATWNGSGSTYIYAAFAENPFKNSLAR